MANNTNNSSGGGSRIGSTLNLLAGLWLIIAPFALAYATPGIMVNSIITGIVVAILGIIGIAAPSALWSRWLNIVAGLWLIVSVAVYSYTGSIALLWDNFIIGVLVVAFAAWSMNAVQRGEHNLSTSS
jgi:hypothetical protein